MCSTFLPLPFLSSPVRTISWYKTEYGDLPLDEDVTRLFATKDLSLLLIAGMEKSLTYLQKVDLGIQDSIINKSIILKVNQLSLSCYSYSLISKKEFSFIL